MIDTNYLDDTAVWLEVYERASTHLSSGFFHAWLVGVGLMGTDRERARKGEAILSILLMKQQRKEP